MTIIEPKRGWQLLNLGELAHYRDLFRFLVWRDIKARYAQTVLGLGWAVLHPVIHMLVFTIIFGSLLQVESDGAPYALFSFAALVPWAYFSGALSASANSLVGNRSLLTKVYFPRLLLPLAPVIAKLIDLAIASAVLLILIAATPGTALIPNAAWLALPVALLVTMLTIAGLGMWLSALAVRYRDVRFALTYALQIMLYAAPVVWPVSRIPEQWQLVYGLYPLAGVIETVRAALLQTQPTPWPLLAIGAASASLICLTGALYFRRMERYFADIA
jgi:lipopolysaccharide transport system permease protein